MYKVQRSFAPRLLRRLIWISDEARLNGIHLLGGPGSGKSRLMGRMIAWLDFLRKVALILIDPTGGTWANFANKILHLPEAQQKKAWKRIIYVDMSGLGTHIVPIPLLYHLTPQESLYTSTQRFLEVVRRMDPALAHASVEGMNSLSRLWTYAGMILMTLGYQVTEAESLLRSPEQWKYQFEQALRLRPDTRPAVDFLRDYATWTPEMQQRRADSLLVKLLPFQVDPGMTAMFGAAQWGFSWEEIVENGKTVILDFSREVNPERRRFKLLWCFLSLVEYLKSRGIGGRAKPVSFIIDEVSQLLGYGRAEQAMLLLDLEELISVIARNFGVWLTIAHQSLTQVEEGMRNVLMQMGTQVIGVVPNPDDALYLSKQFTHFDPHLVKKHEPIWMGVADPSEFKPISIPTIIDWRSVEYSHDEQFLLEADKFRSLGKFQFLVRVAQSEGTISGQLRPMSIANVDKGRYPDYALIAELERRLMKRDGRLVGDILHEIASRGNLPLERSNASKPVATMKEHAYYFSASKQEEDDDDETFRDKG